MAPASSSKRVSGCPTAPVAPTTATSFPFRSRFGTCRSSTITLSAVHGAKRGGGSGGAANEEGGAEAAAAVVVEVRAAAVAVEGGGAFKKLARASGETASTSFAEGREDSTLAKSTSCRAGGRGRASSSASTVGSAPTDATQAAHAEVGLAVLNLLLDEETAASPLCCCC